MTEIPVLVPPASGVLSRSYVTPAMFTAYPTWLDLDDLIPGGAAGLQDDALADVLLAASDWAVGEVENMLLHGHFVQGEKTVTRVKGDGRVNLTPQDVPVRAVTRLAWGADPSFMQPVLLPDPTMWFEDGRRMSWSPGGAVGAFRGPALQFGPPVRASRSIFADWDYVAGFPFGLLSEAVTADAMSITVDDPTSILPGDVLRCYDPGVSEAFTVASSYVPQVPVSPPAATEIPLAAAAQNAHAAGTGVTGFPRRALQSVIAYGVALLMREDVSDEEPAADFGPAARESGGSGSDRGGQASGLVGDARGWLKAFAPVLRS